MLQDWGADGRVPRLPLGVRRRREQHLALVGGYLPSLQRSVACCALSAPACIVAVLPVGGVAPVIRCSSARGGGQGNR
eukprot:15453236-Alexandrium_andersonii.AAC.1